jgi:hypothetical protein
MLNRILMRQPSVASQLAIQLENSQALHHSLLKREISPAALRFRCSALKARLHSQFFAMISSAIFSFWCMWTSRWAMNVRSTCTLIWTFITHPLVHIHQKKKSHLKSQQQLIFIIVLFVETPRKFITAKLHFYCIETLVRRMSFKTQFKIEFLGPFNGPKKSLKKSLLQFSSFSLLYISHALWTAWYRSKQGNRIKRHHYFIVGETLLRIFIC